MRGDLAREKDILAWCSGTQSFQEHRRESATWQNSTYSHPHMHKVDSLNQDYFDKVSQDQ